MLDRCSIVNGLSKAGFRKVHETTKVEEYRRGSNWIYLKVRGTDHPLVIHGRYASDLSQFAAIPGVVRSKASSTPYHNANMRSFEERLNRGLKPTRFGYDFGFSNTLALDAFLRKL